MGKAIAAGLDGQEDMELAGFWGRGDDLDALVSAADVIIDFSLPDGTAEVLEAVLRQAKPLVLASTRLQGRCRWSTTAT